MEKTGIGNYSLHKSNALLGTELAKVLLFRHHQSMVVLESRMANWKSSPLSKRIHLSMKFRKKIKQKLTDWFNLGRHLELVAELDESLVKTT